MRSLSLDPNLPAAAMRARQTMETLARFSVMSRLRKARKTPPLFAKLRVYDGEKPQGNPIRRARSVQEYKDAAGVDEGMDGASTRLRIQGSGRKRSITTPRSLARIPST